MACGVAPILALIACCVATPSVGAVMILFNKCLLISKTRIFKRICAFEMEGLFFNL